MKAITKEATEKVSYFLWHKNDSWLFMKDFSTPWRPAKEQVRIEACYLEWLFSRKTTELKE